MRPQDDVHLIEMMEALDAEVTAPPALPKRELFTHKGNFGKLCVLGGSVGFTGAPVLAAVGALRTGSGLVTVLTPQSIYPAMSAKLLCAMARPLPDRDGVVAEEALPDIFKALHQVDTAVVGPGLGRADTVVRAVVEEALCPLVVDADGINALAGHIDVLETRRDKVTVLTPHYGEFCRLLGEKPRNPFDAARTLAVERGCILVLKGHLTLTAFPDGKTAVNPTGNPGMATGGSGDVLAGMIASLLGQGFDPEWAVPAAVYFHGRAGDLAAEALGEYAMTAADLLTYIPAAMKEAEAREGE